MRVSCSITMTGSPSTIPCTSKRMAAIAPRVDPADAHVDVDVDRGELVHLADLVELEPQRVGDHRDDATPVLGERAAR